MADEHNRQGSGDIPEQELQGLFDWNQEPEDLAGLGERVKSDTSESLLGVDISPPTTAEPEEINFEELLTPLSGPEITLLEKEAKGEETEFMRLSRAQAEADRMQRNGILIALGLAVLYLVLFGQTYLLNTLPAVNSEWLSFIDNPDLRGRIVFILGLLIPIGSFYLVAESARLLLIAWTNSRKATVPLGSFTAAAALVSLILVTTGAIIPALLVLPIWAGIRKVIISGKFKKILRRS